MDFDRTKRPGCQLNIAPLIDIVFLLLIFFMLTANFIINPGLSISLPKAQSAVPQEQQELTIYINQYNELYFNDTKIDISELFGVLKNSLSPHKKVILNADEHIDFGLAVQVIDTAKRAGSNNFIIAAQKGAVQ